LRLRRSHQIAAVILAVAATGRGSPAAASGCPATEPWVRIELRAAAWSSGARDRVLDDLRRTLAGQGIDACESPDRPAPEPLATLAIALPADAPARAEIEVRDAVTQKRVRREVDLAGIPPDGREVAIAIESDELLRASWAEIALDTPRGRTAQVRPQVAGSVGQVLAPARIDAADALGARTAFERTFGGAGVALFGGDVLARLRLRRRLLVEAAGGMRVSPAEAAPHGRVRGLEAGGEAALLVSLAGTGSGPAVEAGLAVSASWLRWTGEPLPGDQGSSIAGLRVVARAHAVGRIPFGRALHLMAAVDLGETVRGVEATDAGQVIAAASGLVLGASLGVAAP
jgi:hypothetical protein